MRAIRCLVAAGLAAAIVTVVTAQQPGGGFGFGQQQDVNVLVFTNTALQEELKVTADQKTKMKPAAEKIAEAQKLSPFGGGGTKGKGGFDKEKMTEYTEKLKAANDEAKKIADETLTADQKKRLKQIAVQAARFNALGDPEAKGGGGVKGGGGGGFVTPAVREIQKEVTAALKLTDAQKTAVKETVDAYNKEAAELRTEYGLGGGGGFGTKGKAKDVDKEKQAEGNKKIDEARKKAWAKIEDGLDATQKTAWKGLVGEPFDLTKLTAQPKKD